MNIKKRQERNLEIAKYLCTIIGQNNNKPIYRTLEEAGVKFDLASTHIAKIKLKVIGKDQPDGTRQIKEEFLNGN